MIHKKYEVKTIECYYSKFQMNMEPLYMLHKARVTVETKSIIITHSDMNIPSTWKELLIPVIICGSAAWHLTVATALVCPDNVCTLALVLTSQIYKDTTDTLSKRIDIHNSGRWLDQFGPGNLLDNCVCLPEQNKKVCKWELPGGLAVKDLALSLLWLRFDLWPSNFHMQQAQPKEKREKKSASMK